MGNKAGIGLRLQPSQPLNSGDTLSGAALLQVTDRVKAQHVEIRIQGCEDIVIKSACSVGENHHSASLQRKKYSEKAKMIITESMMHAFGTR